MTTLTPNITIPNLYTNRINLIKGATSMTRIEVYVNSDTGSDAANRGGRLAPYRSLEFALRDVFELLSARQMVRLHLAGSNPHVLSAGYVFPQVMSPDEITLDPTQAIWDEQAPLVIQADPALLYTVGVPQLISQVADPISSLLVLTTTYLLADNILRGKFIIDSLGNIAAIGSNTGTTISLCDSQPMTAPLRIFDSSVNVISPAVPGSSLPTVNLRGGTAPVIFQGVKIIGTDGGALGLAQGVSALIIGCEIGDVMLSMAEYEQANEGAVRLVGCKVAGLNSDCGAFRLENTLQTGETSHITSLTRLDAIDCIFNSSSPVGFGAVSRTSVSSLVMENCEVSEAPDHGIRMVHGTIHLHNVKIANCTEAGLQMEQNASGLVQRLGGEGNGSGVVILSGSVLFVSSDTNINAGDPNELVVGVNPAMEWTTFFDGDAPHSSRDSSQGASVYMDGEALTNSAAPREAGKNVSGDYQVLPSDQFVFASTDGAASAVTLPPLALNRGRTFIVKKMDAAADQVVVTAFAGDTIDGAATYPLLAQYDSVTVTAPPTGTDWAVVVIQDGGGGGGTINVEQDGVFIGTQPTLNFIGATVVDDPGNTRVNVTISAQPTAVYNCPPGVAVLDFVYISGANTVDRANATSIATAPAIGIVLAKPTGITAQVMLGSGEITGFVGLVPGSLYFLDTVDGSISIAAPAAAGNIVQRLGRAINATTLVVQMTQEFIEL